jgi:hypothetical protein
MSEEQPSKITFEEASGFKFQAAYKAYSDIFDDTPGEEVKRTLNDLVSQLFDKEISYPKFYNEISKHRRGSMDNRRYRKAKIRGKRKRAYRREQQKKNRIARHK